MIDISKYKWFVYGGRDITLVTDHPEFDLQLVKDSKFGYRKIGANHYLVSRKILDIRFKVAEKDVTRIINNSIGWKGTIRNVKVEAGIGGKQKAVKVKPGDASYPDLNDKNIVPLEIDSSNLLRAWVDKKAKELHVIFHSGVHWLYEDVSLAMARQMEKADSQGQFFHYRIRNVKKQRKISG